MRAKTLSSTNLIRKSGPQLRSSATYKGTGTVVHTVPASAQIGDYLVIVGNNGLSQQPSFSDGWASIYSTTSSGSSYFDTTRIHIKICTASDIGSSISLNASDFYFASTFYVFSNPNKMFVNSNPQTSATQISNFLNYSKNRNTSASTSSVTSILVPDVPVGIGFTGLPVYGPNYLKITAVGCNPNSSQSIMGWSGTGSVTQINDGFWWRSVLTIVEQNASNVGYSATSSSAGGMSWIYCYLL